MASARATHPMEKTLGHPRLLPALPLLLWACSTGTPRQDGAGQDGARQDAAKQDGESPALDGRKEIADLGKVGDAPALTTGKTCAPLPSPTGPTRTVHPGDDLAGALSAVASGDTLLLGDGIYHAANLWIRTPGVTVRSERGDREKVIVDGDYKGGSIFEVQASNVTIADISVQHAQYHPIHIAPSGADLTGNVVYNVHVIDPAQQAIKINANNTGSSATHFADNGLVACSHLELTDAGRPHVDPVATGCYTGGIDAHEARGWTYRDNLIEGFYCATGIAEYGIHLWTGSRDDIVERNRLFNNTRAIGLGENPGSSRSYSDSPCPGVTTAMHYGGIVRNNVILGDEPGLFASESGFDTGIALWDACGATVVHNTVYSTGAMFRALDARFAQTSGQAANNFASHRIAVRDNATTIITGHGNVETATAADFVDAANHDLHLSAQAATASDRGVPLDSGLCDEDFDGDPRGGARDIGADER